MLFLWYTYVSEINLLAPGRYDVMKSCRDICRQCLFMCFFIIPIPIGSYTIHNGSSAVVALVTYMVLSVAVPWAYVGNQEACFGPQQKRIARKVFLFSWVLVSVGLGAFCYGMDAVWKEASFWEWPTVGRDIVFIAGMYAMVCLTVMLAYLFSSFQGQNGQVKAHEE